DIMLKADVIPGGHSEPAGQNRHQTVLRNSYPEDIILIFKHPYFLIDDFESEFFGNIPFIQIVQQCEGYEQAQGNGNQTVQMDSIENVLYEQNDHSANEKVHRL